MEKTPKPSDNTTDTAETTTEEQGTMDTTKAPSTLSPENQNFFSRMSEGAKRIVNEAYKGIGADRVVDKLKIVWNEFGIDRHQKEAVRFKSQIDGFSLRMDVLNQGKKKIESKIEELKQKNIPGVELSLQLRIQETEQQIARLLNDKNNAQLKFEERDSKIRLCTNERDRVANRFIERYEGKLRPMEAELEGLRTSRNQMDFSIKGAEIRHKEKLVELNDIEKKRNEIAGIFREIGMSEGEIRKDETMKQLEKEIRNGREKVRIEKENFVRRKAEVNGEIARIEAKANLYRGKQQRFVNIKNGRPIDYKPVENQVDTKKKLDSGRTKEENEESTKNNERLTETYIKDWNNFLFRLSKDIREKFSIEEKDFLEEAGLENIRTDFGNFKDLLRKYMKYKKKPMEIFDKVINKFEKKVTKSSKK